jgi:hypothetical protein
MLLVTESTCGGTDTMLQNMNTCGWSFPENLGWSSAICLDYQFQSNQLNGANKTFYWDFGDGVTSTLEDPFHHYMNGEPLMFACLSLIPAALFQGAN